MNNIIDGVMVSLKIKQKIQEEIEKNGYTPTLAVIKVGDNKSSNVYVKNKKKACGDVGIGFLQIDFPSDVSENSIINEIEKLNNDPNVNGILVQLPLPSGLDSAKIINKIDPVKDVDGLTYENVGNLVLENDCLMPCTAIGIIELLNEYKVDMTSKDVCIIGRSNLIGKPLIQLFLQNDATVSICHSKTKDLASYTKRADILVVAAGYPNLITKDMVNENAVIIDVGINKENDLLCGDVDFDNVKEKVRLITPVPGGVGPMTVASLLRNVLKAYIIQNS